QQPRLVGNVAAGRGTTMLPTSTLRLKSLFVDYVVEPLPGDRSDPQTLRLRGSLDGSAETTISRPGSSPVHINVRISGALPDHVTVTTTSEPPLTETQVYALLGGVPFAYLPGVGGGEAGLGQVLSEQFLAALGQVFVLRVFEPIEEQLQRTLGLELGITFAFNQPITLQVGKYLLRNLLVTYERPLVESSGDRFDLRVSYELPHGLRITYHNDERGINQVEVGYSFTF
ncbi:MAG: translocation/assembly module TamB, partial [Armatimonadetes bacterium]|nr:translocation/assembly module TamB [Armatimonadota bacterium]